MPNSTATIADGQSLSGAVNLFAAGSREGYDPTLCAVITPSGWDTQDITFQVSVTGEADSYVDLYRVADDGAQSEYKIAGAVASRSYLLPPVDWLVWRHLKVRSGTSGSPANQNGAVSLTIVTRDM